MAKRAVELGIDTLVLTDHGTISGVIQMKKACKEQGIKFIPACEMYESPDRTDKSTNKKSKAEDDESSNGIYHITMLPVNNDGWKALQMLIADANTVGFHRKPRTDMHIIETEGLGKNIIATSGCLGSFTSQLILAGRYDEAKKEAIRRSKLFHSYYLEIQDNGSREQDMVNMQLIQMSQETGLPLVYAKDVHYVKAEDMPSHHTLVAMSRKQTVYDCAPYPGNNTYHLASAEEVYDWADENNIPYEAIENTGKIADMCNIDIELGKNLMPEYPHCPPGHTPTTFVRKMLYDYLMEFAAKLEKKKKRINLKQYIKRIERELDTILMKGFPSYFLILWDIMLWATDRARWKRVEVNAEWLAANPDNAKYEFYPEYYVGPGRGSAAGSMVAFLLGITKLDPIEYDFMFERFLNPYRNSPPDIDSDFDGTNHDMLLDFIAQRYGRDRTAQILTFTKYKIRSSINFICKTIEKKDPKTGKTLEYGYRVADEVNAVLKLTGDQAKMPDQSDCTYKKMMEIAEKPEDYQEYGTELSAYVEASKQFRNLMRKYPELNERLEKIEGCIQTSGVHAGGVIISSRPLSLDCPTVMPREDSKAVLPITMWDFPDCEDVGLLKMDLLRTATLRVISLTVEMIKDIEGTKLDLYDIGRDDPETFKYICSGQTHGMFQIAGGGITKYTMQVQPKTQAEIIDILAIYRPGPLDAVLENGNTIAQQYVLNGKRNEKEYLKEVNKALRKFLRTSRGQMIYQEQVMSSVQEIAGYNLGHADTFRRVIGKKKISEMPKLYDEFMYGHKYVIKKYEKLLNEWDSKPKVYGKKDKEKKTPLIEIVSKYNGKKAPISKKEIENIISDAKKAMATYEIPGAVAMGFDEKYAHNLFCQMAKFAGYAFNKPHSGCYADETFQTAYLKCHYPVYFMTALLTVRGDKADKTLENLKEAKRMGIKILPPSVNHSDIGFHPEGKGIRFGLLSIAGVGEKAVEAIVSERMKNGEYRDFNDFYKRTTYSKSPVNRGVYRTLIEAGAFDDMEANRYKLLNHYNLTIRRDKVWGGRADDLAADKNAKSNHSVQYDETAYNEKLALEMEFKLIGIYVSGSPFEDLPFTSLSDMDLSGRREKTFYEIGGRITHVKVIQTKKKQPMAFVTLETQLEPMEITIFPDTYEDVAQHLYKDNIVVVRGYKDQSYYQGEKKDQFVGDKVLVKQAKKLKKQMGISESKPLTPLQDDNNPVLAQIKQKPRKDPVAEMMEDRPKGKKKRDKDDVSKYFDDEEDIA